MPWSEWSRDSTANSKRHILFTLANITVSYTLIFTAYCGLEILQSSLNFVDGLGSTCVAIIYGVYMASCLFGPLVIHVFTAKRAMLCGFFCHTIYIIANFYPTWATLIPASVLLGVMSPSVWVSNGVYFTSLSRQYAYLTHTSLDVVMARFSAVLEQIETGAFFVSSLISIIVLKSVKHAGESKNVETLLSNDSFINYTLWLGKETSPLNELTTYITPYGDVNMANNTLYGDRTLNSSEQRVCGIHYCPYMDDHQSWLLKPSTLLLFLLLGVFLLCNACGIITACFIRTPPPTEATSTPKDKLRDPISLFCNARLYLLLPLFIQSGFLRSTLLGAFNQAYVSCSVGVGMLGFMLMGYSICRSIFGLLSGHLTSRVPRPFHYIPATIILLSTVIIWIVWSPNANHTGLLLLNYCVFGACYGIVKLHMRGMIVLSFNAKSDSGFAQLFLWESLGACVGYAINNFACMLVKTIVCLSILAVGLVCYVILELVLHRDREKAVKEAQEMLGTDQIQHLNPNQQKETANHTEVTL